MFSCFIVDNEGLPSKSIQFWRFYNIPDEFLFLMNIYSISRSDLTVYKCCY